MASIPYDWNFYSAFYNVRVSYSEESFTNMYYGQGGCAFPTQATGNWVEVDETMFYLTNEKGAEVKVYFNR